MTGSGLSPKRALLEAVMRDTNVRAEAERFSDGLQKDYAFMLRMWSALNFSLAAFKHECGLPLIVLGTDEQKEGRSGRLQ
jgi:hypothetical protein